MIEDRFVHQSPFEYEYRFTEYEYDEDRNAFMPERPPSPSPRVTAYIMFELFAGFGARLGSPVAIFSFA